MEQAFKVCAEICHYRNNINEKAASQEKVYQWTKHIIKLEKDLRQYCIFKHFSYNDVWDRFKNQANKRTNKKVLMNEKTNNNDEY